MFERISPEKAGISSRAVVKFIKTLEKYKLNVHSIIMSRGDNIFSETYFAPFNKDFKHRMYSVSKSFVSVAIGLMIEDGKLSLDDKLVDFFPEYKNDKENDLLREMTIRDSLRMCSCKTAGTNWFTCGTSDRSEVYFREPADKIPGTIWRYDSPGSYMLGVIVEKLTGKTFIEVLKERFLVDCGFCKDSYCLQAVGGRAWGDSAVMCTSRDLLTFARFVANKGTWNGKRYMNAEYLEEACSNLASNSNRAYNRFDCLGYGYQVWKAPRDGFAFIGMGDQFAIYDPMTDFLFVINSDNQGSSISQYVLYHALYEIIVEKLSDTPLPEDEAAYAELKELENTRVLNFARGETTSEFAKEIDGVTYQLSDNRMGISEFTFKFSKDGSEGVLCYTNKQGYKELGFGLGKNVFGKFPEEGYSDMVGTVGVPGHKYDCAVSAEWLEAKKLHLKVQVIDKYFGTLNMAFSFKDERVCVQMEKCAEAFLNEYYGFATGKKA